MNEERKNQEQQEQRIQEVTQKPKQNALETGIGAVGGGVAGAALGGKLIGGKTGAALGAIATNICCNSSSVKYLIVLPTSRFSLSAFTPTTGFSLTNLSW